MEKVRTIAVPQCDAYPSMCIVTALRNLLAYRASVRAPPSALLSDLDNRLATFDQFVAVLQSLIPTKLSSPSEKGHVTGHSFRRGLTQTALAAGFSINLESDHGPWRLVAPRFGAELLRCQRGPAIYRNQPFSGAPLCVCVAT